MSLDFSLTRIQPTEVFDRNITHNLTRMASEAGIYEALWKSQDNYQNAGQMIEVLGKGLKLLKSDPERFRAFDSPNGWGTYTNFVPFVESILEACIQYPDARPNSCV